MNPPRNISQKSVILRGVFGKYFDASREILLKKTYTKLPEKRIKKDDRYAVDFGRLPAVEDVIFDLPPDDSASLSVLRGRRYAATPRAQIFLGATSWAAPGLVATLYPPGTKSREYLLRYAEQFNSVELNATHYRVPDPSTLAHWAASAGDGFRFAPKIPALISHQKQLRHSAEDLANFVTQMRRLKSSLGLSFLQLPPNFDLAQLSVLAAFLKSRPADFALAIEFRHESWFAHGRLVSAAFELLRRMGVASVITDTAGRRDVVHTSLTAPQLMVRFVGNALVPSDYARIDAWASRLRSWIQAGLQELYFFVHQAEEADTSVLIRYAAETFQKNCGVALRGAQAPERAGQLSLF